MKQLTHDNDGLIFSPATDVRFASDLMLSRLMTLSLQPYHPGRCNELLKWKPSDLNTVDFKLAIVETTGVGYIVSCSNNL